MTGALRMAGNSDKEVEAWAGRVIPRGVAYARTLLGRAADAEDVVQDVLCRLLEHEEYDLANDGEKIFFRSITNACINRTQRRRDIVSLDAPFEDDTPFSAVVASRRAEDPVEAASAAELREAVEEGLALLPPMQRAALELRAMRYSLNEIARMLSVSASNAGVLVHRGRRQLAERLAPFLPNGRSVKEDSHDTP